MEIALMSASSPLYSAVKVISSVVIFSALIALQNIANKPDRKSADVWKIYTKQKICDLINVFACKQNFPFCFFVVIWEQLHR